MSRLLRVILVTSIPALPAGCGHELDYQVEWLRAMVGRQRHEDVARYYTAFPEATREDPRARAIVMQAHLEREGLMPAFVYNSLAVCANRDAPVFVQLLPLLSAPRPPGMSERLLTEAESLSRKGDAYYPHTIIACTRYLNAMALVADEIRPRGATSMEPERLSKVTAVRYYDALQYTAKGIVAPDQETQIHGLVVGRAREILEELRGHRGGKHEKVSAHLSELFSQERPGR